MFAFSHLIGAWILGKVYEKISKKKLGHYSWFFLLFGALLPDIDFLFDWTWGTELHRTFTHSVLFLIIVPFILWCALHFLVKKTADSSAHSSLFQQRSTLLPAITFGILSHFILDMILSQGIPLFWPSLLHFSFRFSLLHPFQVFTITYFDPATPSFLHSSYTSLQEHAKHMIVDMALGTAWIFYLWWKKKIRF